MVWLHCHGCRWRLLAITLGVLLLGACTTPTPYQPATLPGDLGYREQRVGDNRFRVSFLGNDLTDPETVDSYLLYRAAELTQQLGYDYFVVAARGMAPAAERRTLGVYPSVGYYGGSHGSGFGVGIGVGTGIVRPLGRYRAMADILMFHGPLPAGDRSAYNPREVLRYLQPVVSPEPSEALSTTS